MERKFTGQNHRGNRYTTPAKTCSVRRVSPSFTRKQNRKIHLNSNLLLRKDASKFNYAPVPGTSRAPIRRLRPEVEIIFTNLRKAREAETLLCVEIAAKRAFNSIKLTAYFVFIFNAVLVLPVWRPGLGAEIVTL